MLYFESVIMCEGNVIVILTVLITLLTIKSTGWDQVIFYIQTPLILINLYKLKISDNYCNCIISELIGSIWFQQWHEDSVQNYAYKIKDKKDIPIKN